MAENKQYIVKTEENGSVMISEDVIAAIVAQAVSEVEGIVGLNTKPGSDIADLIGKKNWGKGMKITILSEDSVSIECNVTVQYGMRVVTVGEALQDTIRNAVESMAGVNVASVNVNICGIVRK